MNDFPLYRRDWKDVFTDLRLAQIVCERTNRDTIRVFRTPEQSAPERAVEAIYRTIVNNILNRSSAATA